MANSETWKHRNLVKHYCTGNGLDLGSGGDPIVPTAIQIEKFEPYCPFFKDTYPPQLKGDATDLYWFKDNTLDYVFSSHLIEDFVHEDQVKAIREWARVIKPGGFMVILAPEKGRWQAALDGGQPPNLGHKNEPEIGELSGIIEKIGGFRIFEDRFCNDTDYGLMFVAKKITGLKMKTEVVTVSSRNPTEDYYHLDKFVDSLKRIGANASILGMSGWWKGLMTKPFIFRQWLRDGHPVSDRVIVCDSWDVVFTKTPEEIGNLCAEIYGDAIVFNGEKGCWPRADLEEHFPDKGTPWRYLNSGFMCGPPNKILELLESMNLESIGFDRMEGDKKIEPNDQGEFQLAFTKQPVEMVVDCECHLAQTFSACTADEFEITKDGVINKVTGNTPGVLHFNGGSKNDIMPLVFKEMGL